MTRPKTFAFPRLFLPGKGFFLPRGKYPGWIRGEEGGAGVLPRSSLLLEEAGVELSPPVSPGRGWDPRGGMLSQEVALSAL